MNQFHRSNFLVMVILSLLGRIQPPLTVAAATRRSMMVPGTPVHHGSARLKATGSWVMSESNDVPESVMLLRGNSNEGIVNIAVERRSLERVWW